MEKINWNTEKAVWDFEKKLNEFEVWINALECNKDVDEDIKKQIQDEIYHIWQKYDILKQSIEDNFGVNL